MTTNITPNRADASVLPVVTSLGQACGAAGTRACCLLRHQARVPDALLRMGAGRKADSRRKTLMEHSMEGQGAAASCCAQGRR